MTLKELKEFLGRLQEDNREYCKSEEQSYMDRTGAGQIGEYEKEVYAKALSVRRDTEDIAACVDRIERHEEEINRELENIRLSIASLMPDRKVLLELDGLNVDFQMDES